MKLKFKYSPSPWFFQKDIVKSAKNFKVVAEVKGENAEERNDNGLIISCAPDLLFALLAEQAYSSMDCQEGDQILEELGYKDGSKMAFVKNLRKEALKKCGIDT